MIVAIGICPNDQAIAFKLAKWIQELGGAKGHKCVLVYDDKCEYRTVEQALALSFDEVKIASLHDNLSKWPNSANRTFSTAVRHVEFFYPKARYWFFWEPDCIPLEPGSLDTIEKAFRQAIMDDNKVAFMGAKVAVEGVPLHMSGNAIWPAPLVKYAGEALIADEIAFDVFAAGRIIPRAHFTDLIAHSWDRSYQTGLGIHSFPDWKSVQDQVIGPHPNAVFYHGDKSGTLIDRLRERRAGEQNAKDETQKSKADARSQDQNKRLEVVLTESAVAAQPNAAPLQFDIFIKTYPKDYPWLKYCLRSIDKFCSGFRRVVVVSPETNSKEFTETVAGFKINILPICNPNEFGDGYLFQQSVKLHADEYTDAHWILFTDSDTIFTCPVSPETYLSGDRFNWMITPYTDTDAPWQPMTAKFMGDIVYFEFMRRHPFLLPRWLFKSVRQFCIEKHLTTMHAYIEQQPQREFSEFNVLGAYAFASHNEKFNWIPTNRVAEKDWPTLTVDQQWSHNPIPVEKWEKILNGGGMRVEQPNGDGAQPSAVRGRLTAVQIPWKNRLESVEEITRLSKELKRYCTAPSHTKYVRDSLKRFGVIK